MIHEGRVDADKCEWKRLVEIWSSGGKGFLPAACPQSAYSEPNFRAPISVVLATRHK